MLSFTKILCPTDFSEPSLCAFIAANEMAHHFDSEVLLLNVHNPVPRMPKPRVAASETTFDLSAYHEALRKNTEEALATIRDSVLNETTRSRLIVRMGKPAEEILALAAEEQVDAIFMATRGRSGIGHLVFGSVAEKVVRSAQCPVMTFNNCDRSGLKLPSFMGS